MRNSKNVLLSLVITIALGLFSTLALAEGGLPDVENVCAKLKESSAALASGASNDAVSDLAKQAIGLTKDIIVSDKVTIKRTKATNGIKAAVAALKKDDKKAAGDLLKQATEDFEGLKKYL
ncbi:MAG: hypothetical protein HOP02_09635 [Methylococcaceae bacterium]|nr:hypothetical protein [Methylococcaceae bacterium]